MKLCYLVYREDNVMVYESQVLEYLRAMKEKHLFESIEFISMTDGKLESLLEY